MKLRTALRTLASSLVLLAVACGGDDEASTTGTAAATTATQGSGGAGGSTSGAGGEGGATSTGEGGGGLGGHGGASDLASLLVGDWKPTGMDDSGMGFKPAKPNDPFFVFMADHKLALGGCGTPANATWTFTEGGAPGALGIVSVSFGATTINWYVIELDATKFVFGEGGDKFYFERAKCS
ncbi:MAG: hypothetical protein FJ096_07430 [Deltaproteobacteria bacterium]|nr:hypothetical protein [Deltaproteobacteria bacterium]